MISLEFALPVAILVLGFLIKLVVDQAAALPDLITALLELPVDMAFLAITLIAGFTISHPEKTERGLIEFIIYVIGAVVIAVLWRRSHRCFIQGHPVWSGILAIIAYTICIWGLYRVVGTLGQGT